MHDDAANFEASSRQAQLEFDEPSSNGNSSSADQAFNSQQSSTWSLIITALLYSNGAQQLDISWPNSLLAMILVMLMLTTAVGNLFVIVAILIERNLRTIGNYLVLSLAIADLLVACLVMPLAGIYQILDRWTLGVLLCDIWTSTDVFCCTASILHLLAIALDRYWAVTRVDYIRCQRNKRRILHMILFVWMAAAIISLAPVFGWKDAEFELRITNDNECLLSQDIGYQIFATCTTFYFPLTLTLIFYWKIYQVARKRIRRKPGNRVQISLQQPSSSSSNQSAIQHSAKAQMYQCHKSIVECSRSGGFKSSIKRQHEDYSLCLCSCHRASEALPPAPSTQLPPDHRLPNAGDELLTDTDLGRRDNNIDDDDDSNNNNNGNATRSSQQAGEGPIHLSDFRDTTVEKTTGSSTDPSTADGCCDDAHDGDGDNVDNGNGVAAEAGAGAVIKRTLNDHGDNPISETGGRKLRLADNLIYDTTTDRGQSLDGGCKMAQERNSAPRSKLERADMRRYAPASDTYNNQAGNGMAASSGNNRRSASSDHDDGDSNSLSARISHQNAAECKWSAPGEHHKHKCSSSSGKRQADCQVDKRSLCSLNSSMANGFGSGPTNQAPSGGSPPTRARCNQYGCCGCCCPAALELTSEQQESSGGSARQVSDEVRIISDSSTIAPSTTTTTTATAPSQTRVTMVGQQGTPVAELVAPLSSRPQCKNSRRMVSWLGVGSCNRLATQRPTSLSAVIICWRRLEAQVRGKRQTQVASRALIGDSQSQDDAVLGGLHPTPSVVLVAASAGGADGEQCNNLQPNLASSQTTCTMCQCQLIDHQAAINELAANSSEQGQAAKRRRDQVGGMAMAAASTAHIAIKTTVKSPPTLAATAAAGSSNSAIHRQSSTAACATAEGLESKRERKAAKTLAIITGVFVMCWLPFFVMAIAMPLLNLKPHKYVFATLQWLGYINSMLNPIIYTIFSPDFRVAFKRLLCGLDRSRNERRRKEANRFSAGGLVVRSPTSNSNNNNNNSTNCTYDTSSNHPSATLIVRIRAQLHHIPPMFAHHCCCCLPLVTRDKDTSTSTATSNTQHLSQQHKPNVISASNKHDTTTATIIINNNNNNLGHHLPPDFAKKNTDGTELTNSNGQLDQQASARMLHHNISIVGQQQGAIKHSPRLQSGGITNDF